MKIRRLMIGAVKSGSGKTTVTCGLLQAWKDQGKAVAACKCGPDYIDPMFHQRVLGIPSKNLDTFFTGEQETKRLLLQDRKEGDFVLLEGVMGLYDGLGGIREEGSSYHLAQVTKTPIVLLVDAKGMGRSHLPLLSGFLQYDRDHLIKGVILNRISYYKVIGPMIEGELGLSVVGYVPDHKRFFVESRHLGLYMPHEMDGLKDQLCQIAEELKKTLSLEKLWSIGEAAEALEVWAEPVKRQTFPAEKKRPLIAVAMDEAFCFYYEDNLRLLEAYGASLAYVSPIHDRSLPKGCCGLLLGGGYPELYGEPLSQNKAMRRAIKAAIEGGMPAVAEWSAAAFCTFMNTSGIERAMYIPWPESFRQTLMTQESWCVLAILFWKKKRRIFCRQEAGSKDMSFIILTAGKTEQAAGQKNRSAEGNIPA